MNLNNYKRFLLYSVVFVLASLITFTSFNNVKNLNKKAGKELNKIELKKARSQYFFNLLRDPKTNAIPENIRVKEIRHARSISNSLRKSNNSGFNFTEVGPYDIGGRTRALAIDINNSNTVIAAGVSGGIWKSTDNGDTWQFKSNSTDILSITSIVQDPREGFTNKWYASGGEFNGSSASDRGYRAYFRGNGIYKSEDNGETWTIINSTESNPTKWDSNFDYVSRLVINPVTGSLFGASHGQGIIKSTDEGQSFTTSLGAINDHYYCDVVVKPNGTLIAVLSNTGFNSTKTNQPGVYVSTDDGANWTDITPTNFPTDHQRSVLGTSQISNSKIFYVLTYTGSSLSEDTEDIRFFKLSTDGSVTEELTDNLPSFSTSNPNIVGNINSQGGYNLTIGVKPDDDNFVLIAGTSLYRSTDGFSTKPNNRKLQWIGGYHPDEFFYPNLHPDIHIITFDPNDFNKVWVGHDGGLSYTTNILDESFADFFPWIKKNNGYNVTQFYTVSLNKNQGDNRIMGGTQDNGTPYFKLNDLNTDSYDVSSGDGSYCYFANKVYAYTSIYNGKIYRYKYTSSGNLVWDTFTTDVTPADASGQLFINPFVIDPNSSEKYMYYPAGNTLWRNNDIRQQNDAQPITKFWEELTNLGMPTNYTITTMAVSNNNPQHRLYYAGYNSDNLPLIYKVDDAHTATSGYIDISIPEAVSGAYPHHIAVNPDNGNEIFVVFSNYNITGLYHSTDGGTSYTAVEGNLTGDDSNPGPSIRRAAIMPYNGGYIYFLATSTGLYSTQLLDGANTVWTLEGTNTIGNVVVEYLDVRTIDNTMAVATHGRGIFIGSPNPVSVENNKLVNNNFKLAQNYPNPFNPSTNIEFTIPKYTNVNLTVYNSLGERVQTLVNKQLAKGNYNIKFEGSNLSSGIYFYQLTAGDFSTTKKMILNK